MGQVNRVDSARLAVLRAGDRAAGSVAASDAYFPFADGFEILAEAGVRAVAEPGGSIRDHLTVTAAEAAGVSLYFTGVRHFYPLTGPRPARGPSSLPPATAGVQAAPGVDEHRAGHRAGQRGRVDGPVV